VRQERGYLTASATLTVLSILVTLALPWPLAFSVDHALGDLPAPAPLTDWSPRSLLMLAALATIVLTAVSGLLDAASVAVGERAAERVGARLRSDAFGRSLELSLSWHATIRRGELVSRLTSDTSRVVDALIAVTSTLAPEMLALVAVLTVLVVIDPLLAVIGCAVIPLLAIVAIEQRKALRQAQQEARAAYGDTTATATELLRHVPAIQAFARSDAAVAGFEHHNGALLAADQRVVATEARWMPRADIVLSVGAGMVLALGGFQVLNGVQTVGHLLVVIAYLRELYAPVRALTRLSVTLARATVSAERVADVVEAEAVIPEAPGAIALDTDEAAVGFEGVTFGYDPVDPVICELVWSVPAGRTVCLTGPNGAGKSTLLLLLLRLYDADWGSVRVAGHDVRDLTLESLRTHISYVPQDPWLIDATLAENIAFGCAGATYADVIDAARATGVDQLAQQLPQGYDTPLREGAARLSGGQRRRVALARAVLRDAPLLLLDEPTASLDDRAVAEVAAAIAAAAQGRTAIVVTHDERLFGIADEVVPLGSLQGRGPHILPAPPGDPMLIPIGRR
jgi:ATP-binding cassette subfamily B protein